MENKTRFFKNVLLFQFIPILIIGLLILSNFREQKILKIWQIHPYEFNYGYALPLFIFAIGLILSLVSLVFKQEDSEQIEEEELKKLRRYNFWKFAFYSNMFFALFILILSIVIFQKEPVIITEPVFFYIVIFSRCLFLVLLSLVIASFFLTAGIYQKSNATMSYVIVIFSFFIIGSSCAYDYVFVTEAREESDFYSDHKKIKKTSPDVETESVEITDQEYQAENVEGNEEKNKEEEKEKLLFSFNYLVRDCGGFEGKDDFFDIRNRIQYNLKRYIGDEEDEYYYLIRYLNGFRFSKTKKVYSDEFYLGFEKYKTVLYEFISPKTYHVSNFDKIINALLLAYEDIGDNRGRWQDIYNTMNNDDDTKLEDYYEILEDYHSPKIIAKIEEIRFSNGSKFKKSDIMWLYSFWARRDEEGNRKETAIILNEIKEHYEISDKE